MSIINLLGEQEARKNFGTQSVRNLSCNFLHADDHFPKK